MGLELTSFFSFCLDRMLCSTTGVAALQKNIEKNLANAQHDPRQTILIYSLMIIELLQGSIFEFFKSLEHLEIFCWFGSLVIGPNISTTPITAMGCR